MIATLCNRCGIITTTDCYHYTGLHRGSETTFDLCPDCASKLNYFLYEDDEHLINRGKDIKDKKKEE